LSFHDTISTKSIAKSRPDIENIAIESNTKVLNLLLEKVYLEGGYDFRDYKRGTLMRRLDRRLYATGTKSYLEYIQFLDTHPEEYGRLANYLTILVSGFFRSPYTFQQMAGLVLPELVLTKVNQGEHSLRFWSTACGRGEEPYSIAILLAQFLGDKLGDFDIQIYATDINRQALREAEAGVYSRKDVESLPPGIRERYFVRNNGGYEVRTEIRQMVRFSHFDLTSTIKQPFTDLDCLFCCNILIYLQEQLQKRLLSMLYEALAIPGYLILGEAEVPTKNLREKVKCLDVKARIYKKNGEEWGII